MSSFDRDAWERASSVLARELGRSGRRRVLVSVGRARWAVVAACGLLLAATPLAVAGPSSGGSGDVRASASGDVLREGIRNPRRGAATRETQVISGVRGERYGTRQSNISTGADAGGAAIYGCRRPTRECTRHVNLRGGPAAHFATAGSVPFTIDANATGMITGLNAERVGGMTAAELRGQTGPQGATGPRGATGPKGDKGDKGDTGPSTGAAGGDLTGNYPDPEIAPLAVTTGRIADGAVTKTKANGADFLTRNAGGRALRFFAYEVNTGTAGQWNFGRVQIDRVGTNQIRVCPLTIGSWGYGISIDGGSLAINQPGSQTCGPTHTTTTGGTFQINSGQDLIFGSGSTSTTGYFFVYGFFSP